MMLQTGQLWKFYRPDRMNVGIQSCRRDDSTGYRILIFIEKGDVLQADQSEKIYKFFNLNQCFSRSCLNAFSSDIRRRLQTDRLVRAECRVASRSVHISITSATSAHRIRLKQDSLTSHNFENFIERKGLLAVPI